MPDRRLQGGHPSDPTTALRVRKDARTGGSGALRIQISSRGDVSELLHLIDVPGREPVEIGMFRQASCRTCLAEARADDGRVVVLHTAECAGARAVSEAIGDVVSVEDTNGARRALADEYVDDIIDDEQKLARIAGTTDLRAGELADLREQLSEVYLAGLRRGERLVLAAARASLSRIRQEIDDTLTRLDAWSPVAASSTPCKDPADD